MSRPKYRIEIVEYNGQLYFHDHDPSPTGCTIYNRVTLYEQFLLALMNYYRQQKRTGDGDEE